MPEWITYILIPLISALIGGGLTLAGVIVTIKWEAKQKKQEEIEKVKPIIICVEEQSIKRDEKIYDCEFYSNGDSDETLCGVFKNTDNGILFLDMLESELKTYRPHRVITVDKNTYFRIILINVIGESLEELKLYCHDIFGNKYIYEMDSSFEPIESNNVVIKELQPFC